MHTEVPVLNRYYGVFESGKIKVRGIEAVRRDTPPLVGEAQMDMIRVLSRASSSQAFTKTIPEAVEVLTGYVDKLRKGDVDVQDLIIAKQLSMDPSRYAHDVFQAIAAKQLMREGIEVNAGQRVHYVITDAQNKRPDRRVRAAQLIKAETRPDVKKYTDMLVLAGANILSPFGYDEEMLKDRIVYGEKQTVLKPALETTAA